MFNEQRVSVWHDEKVLEKDSGGDCYGVLEIFGLWLIEHNEKIK